MIKYYFTILINLIISISYSQSDIAALVYPEMNFKGTPLKVRIGDEINITQLNGINKSVEILLPCGIYLYQGENFSGTYIYISSTISEIAKPYSDLGFSCIPEASRPNNQYDKVGSVRCVGSSEIPQPSRWVPVDGRDIPTGHPSGNCSTPPMIVASSNKQRILTVRKAFIWESTDCWLCAHGPWEELGVQIVTTDLTQNFKLAGPTPYAHDKPFCGCWPSDEWGDDGQGMIYSNYGVLDWSSTQSNSVDVFVRGGDNFKLIKATIDRDSNEPVFAISNYGYIILQNIEGLETRICDGNKYISDFPVSDAYWDGPNGPFHNYPLKGTAHFPYDNLDISLANTSGTLVFSGGNYPIPNKNIINQKIILKTCGRITYIGTASPHAPAKAVDAEPNCDCGPFKN